MRSARANAFCVPEAIVFCRIPLLSTKQKRSAAFLWFGYLLAAFGTAAVVSLHRLEPSIDAVQLPLSFYVHSPHRGWFTVALIAIAVAMACFGLAQRDNARITAYRFWFGVGSLLVSLVAVLPCDPWLPWQRPPTLVGALHGIVGGSFFVFTCVFAGWHAWHQKGHDRWRARSAIFAAMVLAALAVSSVLYVAITVWFRSAPQYLGLLERIWATAALTWFAATAFRIQRLSEHEAE